jgi:hypothetical protein
MLPLLLGTLGGPLLQGALAGTALGTLSATTLGAGIAGLTSLAQGNDILTAGLDAFGGYGGAGAVGNLAKTGAAAAGASALPKPVMGLQGAINPEYASLAGDVAEAALPTAAGQGTTTFFGPPAGATTPFSFSNVGAGVKDLFSPGGAERFTEITKASPLSSVGVPAAGAVLGLAGMGPQQMGAPQQSLGFGEFVPLSERRRQYADRMGYAEGGIAALNPMMGVFDARNANREFGEPMGGYKKGGFLNGPGDGMSDDIPATIEGKQPARLADGEFVVPADVVSHLGNGSTKAGAQRLYAMMDKVRKARTGTTKQGKQIKPEKYLPA